MITDIFKPIDDSCNKSLKSIQKALGSDSFLAGLGKLNKDYPIPKGFNVVTDFDRCNYLLSEEMYEIEDNKEGVQNFTDVLSDSIDYLGYSTYDRNEADRRMRGFEGLETSGAWSEYRTETIMKAYERNGVSEFLLNNFQNATPEAINEFVEYPLFSYIDGCFHRFIRCAYFGGLQKWPVYAHFLKCFSIGGFPTGWVGPMPINGGKSRKCVQILHFGPSA